MITTVAIIALIAINIIQAVDKYLYTQRMLKMVDDAIKASKTTNINDYIAATNIEAVKKEKFVQTDEVLLDEASDEEFDKFIKGQNAPTN